VGALNTSPAELLQRVELFSGLSRMALAQVAAHVDVLRLEAGETVFAQGDPPDALYIVGEGHVGVFARSGEGRTEIRLNTLHAGEVFGEMALLTDEPRSAEVRADPGGAEVLRLERERFLDLVRREPTVAHVIAATLTRRLQSNVKVIVQGETALVSTVQQTLSRHDPATQERILRAVLLDDFSPDVLRAVFGDQALPVAAHLGELGVDLAQPSGPVVGVLREAAARAFGQEKIRQLADETAATLAAAHRWGAALALLFRHGTRGGFVSMLGQALRAPEPPARDDLATWLDRITDDEAAQDIELALAKAALYEEREESAAALGLLRRTLGVALQEHHAGGRRISAEIARIAGEMGSAPSAALKFGLEIVPARRLMGPVLRLLFIGAALILGALAFSPGMDVRWRFVLLLGGAIALWMSDSVAPSAVSLALLAGWILSAVATADQAVAGFGTKDWLFVVALMGLAAAIARSGLLFRVGLLLIRRMPRGLVGQAATLMLTGVLLSPVLPTAMGRTALTAPLARGIAQALRLGPNEPPAAVLGLATWIGSGPLLFTFLNASPACLLAWALLPEASRSRFDWVHWFLAAAPLTVLIAAGMLGAMFVVLRPRLSGAVAPEKIELQLAVLGPPSTREVAMTVILVLTIAGWVMGPAIHLDAATVAVLGLIAAFLTGNLDHHAWREVDWSYLVFFGVLLGMGRLMGTLGLDRLAGETAGAWLTRAGITPFTFVLLTGVLGMIMSSLVGEQAVLFLSLSLIPVAKVIGVDPWIAVIVVLSTVLVWLVPATTPEYLAAYSASEGVLFSHAQARKVAFAHAAVTLIALGITTLYWRWLGLM
jgi:CRP-like cAMP-binding protein/di/tricarboxylate transporter